ncbi:MAG: hypothetical protein AB1420_15955 [Bacillota bacterium]
MNIYLRKKKGIRNWWLRRKIPLVDKMLLYVICSLAKKTTDYIKFRAVLFLTYKELRRKGYDFNLPYYWGTHGVYPEWNTIKDRIDRWGYELIVFADDEISDTYGEGNEKERDRSQNQIS